MAHLRQSRLEQMKLNEGWLEHKGSNDTKWSELWCVLKGRMMYFFSSELAAQTNHSGTLQVTPDTKFTNKEGDTRKGWKFELRTGRRYNKFRAPKFTERELWRAYICGLFSNFRSNQCSTTGSTKAVADIPSDLDLPIPLQQEITTSLQRCLRVMQVPPLPHPVRSDSPLPRITGLESPHDSADGVFTTTIIPDNSRPIYEAVPTIRHKFWRDPTCTEIPTWFFEGITRSDAESILNMCACYGNTLMRESVTFRGTGSYVITKRSTHRGVEINHFEVTRVTEGFRINVENMHHPMICLSDVMDYFVAVSGIQTTFPMSTNNPKKLVIDVPDYQTKIFRTSHDDESGEELDEAYEEPMEFPVGQKTWSQPMMNKEQARSNVSQTMSAVQRDPRTMLIQEDLNSRVNAARAIGILDQALNCYSDDPQSYGVMNSPYTNSYANESVINPYATSYANESLINQMRDLNFAPPPPAPGLPGPPPPPVLPCPSQNRNQMQIYANDSFAPRSPPPPPVLPGPPQINRNQMLGIYANDPFATQIPQQRSRSNSVPNVIHPVCNFNVSVPVSSQIPAPGMVAPGMVAPGMVAPAIRYAPTSPYVTNPANAGNLQRTDTPNMGPPTKRKTWFPQRNFNVGCGNKACQHSHSEQTGSTGAVAHSHSEQTGVYDDCSTGAVAHSHPEQTGFCDDCSTGAVAVNFKIPDKPPEGDSYFLQQHLIEPTVMNKKVDEVVSGPVSREEIKAKLERMLVGALAGRPNSRMAPNGDLRSEPPEITVDTCEEDYEDISNYVNIN